MGSQNAYQLSGGFRPERGWWFNPLLEDDLPVTEGEPAAENPWIRANHEVARHLVAYLNGTLSAEEAASRGLFNLERARAMEALFLPYGNGHNEPPRQNSPRSPLTGSYNDRWARPSTEPLKAVAHTADSLVHCSSRYSETADRRDLQMHPGLEGLKYRSPNCPSNPVCHCVEVDSGSADSGLMDRAWRERRRTHPPASDSARQNNHPG